MNKYRVLNLKEKRIAVKEEKSGKMLLGGLVFLLVCSNVWAGWSTPVLVAEPNYPGGEVPMSPALSNDGLILYFHREIPALGYTCIVETSRDTQDDPFIFERVLTELVTSGYGVMDPWVSEDGLRIYYKEKINESDFRLKMAERTNISDPNETWTPVRTFEELHINNAYASEPSLTSDELMIFFHSQRSGGMGGADLWVAIRNSSEESFGNLRPLYELNTSSGDYAPFVLPDGLTLYFLGHDRDGLTGPHLFRATRTSTTATFGNVQPVEIPTYKSHWESSCYVTPDETTIFYEGGVGDEQGIWASNWAEKIGTFHVDVTRGDNNNDGLSRASAFAAIQYAIDACADGSMVLVWPGVYNEHVDFKGKAIIVQSAAEAAQIRTGTAYAFSFHTGEEPDTVLNNFVICDSEYGIYLTNGSSPTIRNLTIVNNEYGISAFDGSNPDISNCILWSNRFGDLFDCQATYSCIEDGSQGEGNIDAYPLFADPAQDDYHLKSERGRHIPVDPTLPLWTGPVHLSELDDAQGNKAVSPCLSSDGLSMYFARYIPTLAHGCIVEAKRSTPFGEFTSERVLTELVGQGDGMNTPWISEDGLRLYYTQLESGIGYVIKMARRSSIGDSWTPSQRFDELNEGYSANKPTLTGDELEIFYSSPKPGSAGGHDLWTATRSSVDDPFGNTRPLYEINSAEFDAGPHIMPDGLTLYFISMERDGYPAGNLFKAMRSSRSDIFGNVQLLELPGYIQQAEACPYISPDEKIIYYQESVNGVYVSELNEGQWVMDYATSPCVDAGDPAVNPVGEPMPNGGRINMGAYGGTDFASMSEWPIEGDINRDGIVNIGDLAVLSRDWMSRLPWVW